jgi:hypothetical protein
VAKGMKKRGDTLDGWSRHQEGDDNNNRGGNLARMGELELGKGYIGGWAVWLASGTHVSVSYGEAAPVSIQRPLTLPYGPGSS